MKKSEAYRFVGNAVNLGQYIKNIDQINSILIIGNTTGLFGYFMKKSNEEYYEYPDFDPNNSCDNMCDNLDMIERLINKNVEIYIICNRETSVYWDNLYTYFCKRLNRDSIANMVYIINNMKDVKILDNLMGRNKFDVIISNAPYDNGLHEKFEAKYFDLCNSQIVWVSPLSFLLGKRQNKKITLELDKYKTDIEQINGNEYFDAAIGGTIGIVSVDMSDRYTHYVKFDGKVYEKCSEITTYSNDELLVEFKNIVELLYKEDNLDNHLKVNKKRIPSGGDNRFYEPNPNINWTILQINRYKAGPYAIITNTKELSNKVGIYQSYIKHDKRIFYFAYNHKIECLKSLKYFKTYFCRCCLYLSMHNDELVGGGALKTVPWFDFSDPIFEETPEEIDIALFKRYNVSQEVIDHILEVLPNYYDLDLTKYKV